MCVVLHTLVLLLMEGIGTGDNARCVQIFLQHSTSHKLGSNRHDNDRKLPRSTNEIYDLNRAVSRKMNEVFTSRGIPVIPSLGELSTNPYRASTI